MIACLIFDRTAENFVELRVYFVDTLSPSIRLLTTVVKPDWASDFHFKDGLLAIGWQSSDSYYISIRQVPFPSDQVEAEVVMKLDNDMVRNANQTRGEISLITNRSTFRHINIL